MINKNKAVIVLEALPNFTHGLYINYACEPRNAGGKKLFKMRPDPKNRTQNCGTFVIKKFCSQLQMCSLIDAIH